MTRPRNNLLVILAIAAFFSISATGQTTELTYQGHLQNGGTPANGNYDLELRLFDSPAGGTQLGPLITRTNVAVTNGIFGVHADFGSVFPGADRFLEIQVRLSGVGAYTLLDPRQRVNSAPYSIKSLSTETAATADNALQLGGVSASQYVITTDPRMTDARPPTPGSTSYIQNGTVTQATSNFNISGNGTAAGTLRGGIVSATTQFNMGPNRVLYADFNFNSVIGIGSGTNLINAFGNSFFGWGSGNDTTLGSYNSFFGSGSGGMNVSNYNAFFGAGSGSSNTGGTRNSFFGYASGRDNLNGNENSFFGSHAGEKISAGSSNSLFGTYAGYENVGGSHNSFFGWSAGKRSTGSSNSFFGSEAGLANTSGQSNSFFGRAAGVANTTGFQNSFFGSQAGGATTIGDDNVFIGYQSGNSNTDGSENVFVGSGSGVANTTGDNNTFVGKSAGFFNLTGSNNSFVGFQAGAVNKGSNSTFMGHTAGVSNTDGFDNSFFGTSAGQSTTLGSSNSFFGKSAGSSNTSGVGNSILGTSADLSSGNLNNATAIGYRAAVGANHSLVLGSIEGVNNCDFTTACFSVKVGIGTTTPETRLHVVGGTDAEPASGGFIVAGATNSLNIAIDSNEIMARDSGGTATLAINADGGNVNLIQGGTGNVGIGTTTPGDKLDVDGDIRVGTSGTNGCLKNNNGGPITGTCSSDARFKRNVSAFPTVLNKVAQLRPVNYFWRAEEFPGKEFGRDQTYGLVAQDVEKVLPDLVSIDAQGYKQIDYGKLPLLTIQAVIELNSQNETLKAQVNEQKAQISALTQLVCRRNPKAKICRTR